MSLVARNEPCPCGSGRKYKKCCLAARDAAVATGAGEVDVKAIIDRAIETKHWGAVDGFVDRALKAFAPGAPLEYVRFHDRLVVDQDPANPDMTKLCTAGWVERTELEIARVLDRTTEPSMRDGLRMAVHLLRRFGARSPIVEDLGKLQVAEHQERRRRFTLALTSRGLTLDEFKAQWTVLVGWLQRVRPPLLAFAEWFALRAAQGDRRDELWLGSIAHRVSDRCLDRLDDRTDDARPWLQLAALMMFSDMVILCEMILEVTPLLAPSADELAVHDAFTSGGTDVDMSGTMIRICDALEARGDHRGVALMRETTRQAQAAGR